MKKLFLVLLFIFALSSAAFAKGIQMIWAGGGMRVSNEAQRLFTAKSMISLGRIQ